VLPLAIGCAEAHQARSALCPLRADGVRARSPVTRQQKLSAPRWHWPWAAGLEGSKPPTLLLDDLRRMISAHGGLVQDYAQSKEMIVTALREQDFTLVCPTGGSRGTRARQTA